MAATAVTPSGVRDGDPDALAGLCDRRGPAVLAYCEVIAGRAAAGSAAAEAFGNFRAGVVAAPDLDSLNPEALLIGATRHAAARHAAAAPGACSRVPALLAARADRSITLADHDWLEEHLATCWTCRAPVARFEAADRAYGDPPRDPLAADVKAAMVAAMTAAAPVRGEAPPPSAVPGGEAAGVYGKPAAPVTNGHQHPDPHEDPYAVADLEHPLDQQTSAYALPPEDGVPEPPAAEPAKRRARRGSPLAALRAGRSRRSDPPTAGPPDMLSGDAAGAAAGRAGRVARRKRPARDLRNGSTSEPRVDGGTSLPRPARPVLTAARRREHSVLRPAIVLPIALLLVAIVVGLVLAGVFGGGEPESPPQSFTPARSAPARTSEAPVVVVPSTAASAAAVEKAKAQARAARRAAERKRSQAGAATSDDAPAAAAPPAAAADPAPAAAPAPPPADETSPTSGKPKVDAGKGATGAEELPPAQDTSTIPELAPPVEPATPPQ